MKAILALGLLVLSSCANMPRGGGDWSEASAALSNWNTQNQAEDRAFNGDQRTCTYQSYGPGEVTQTCR